LKSISGNLEDLEHSQWGEKIYSFGEGGNWGEGTLFLKKLGGIKEGINFFQEVF